MYFGFSSLLIAVVLLGIGDSVEWLIVSRLLQGFSAAGVLWFVISPFQPLTIGTAVTYTVGLALIADTVDPRDIGRCMGFALSSMSFGILVGPLLGGFVFAKAGYYAVIAMMAGLVLLDMCLPFGFVEKRTARKWLETVSNEADEDTGLLSDAPTSSEAASEFQGQPPISKHKSNYMGALLKSPQILAALWGVIVQLIILTSFDAVLTVFLEETFEWSSLEVGLAFLCLALPLTMLGPVAGTISDRYGPRWPAIIGCLLTAPPLILMQLITHPSTSQTAALILLLISTGKLQCKILTLYS